MAGREKFDCPLSALTGISMYNELQGVRLEFGEDTYILLMNAPYLVPKILELLGKSFLFTWSDCYLSIRLFSLLNLHFFHMQVLHFLLAFFFCV